MSIERKVKKLEERVQPIIDKAERERKELAKKEKSFQFTNDIMLVFFPEHAWNNLDEDEKWRIVKNNETSDVYYEVTNLVLKFIDWLLEVKRNRTEKNLEALWIRDKEKVIESAKLWYEDYKKFKTS